MDAKDPALDCPKVNGTGLRAQGKNNKKHLFSPYALRLTPCAFNLLLAKPLNSDLTMRTRFLMFNNIKRLRTSKECLSF
jgi:hypothetical protein